MMVLRQFLWFCAVVGVLVLGGVIVIGAKDGAACWRATCEYYASCEDSCDEGYQSCRTDSNHHSSYTECTIDFQNCMRTCRALREEGTPAKEVVKQ